MLEVQIQSLRGTALTEPRMARFDTSGGTMGRADSNTLVLDDPERTVSRVHAQVLCRNGQFFIVDRGSNPLHHNGNALGAGNEALLSSGDRLLVGSFELRVQVVEGAAGMAHADPGAERLTQGVDDPFADLMAGIAPASPPAAAGAQVAKNVSAEAALFPDPLGWSPAAASPASADPFGSLLDFGASSGAGLVPAPAGSASAASSIDALFGLGGNQAGADPLALSPLADPLMQPNTASSADPLQALQRAAAPIAASQGNHVPVLQQAYVPPLAQAQAQAVAAPSAAPTSPPAAAKVVLDFDFEEVSTPVFAAPSPAPAPVVHPPDVLPAEKTPVPPPAPVAMPVVPPGTGGAAVADSELMAAFLRGVGSSHQMPVALTPELMERIGALLRTSADGVLQLLLTRQEFKRGVRSEVTMISTEANNPLKFSPSVEVALAHLLGPGVRGFMGPEQAMANAFADLRAHQFGVMVGLRAALEHVLGLFTPETLEQRITEKSRFDALFSANRKARLWDQFCLLYAGIATEAEDDFHSLFGKAFAEAYDEQMERFKSEP